MCHSTGSIGDTLIGPFYFYRNTPRRPERSEGSPFFWHHRQHNHGYKSAHAEFNALTKASFFFREQPYDLLFSRNRIQ